MIRAVSGNTVALRLSTGAVVCAQVQSLSREALAASAERPLWAQASLGEYSVGQRMFTGCELLVRCPLLLPQCTTQFRRVLPVW